MTPDEAMKIAMGELLEEGYTMPSSAPAQTAGLIEDSPEVAPSGPATFEPELAKMRLPFQVASRAVNVAGLGIPNMAASGLLGLLQSIKSGDFDNFSEYQRQARAEIERQQEESRQNPIVEASMRAALKAAPLGLGALEQLIPEGQAGRYGPEALGLIGGMGPVKALTGAAERIPGIGKVIFGAPRATAGLRGALGTGRQLIAQGGLLGSILGGTKEPSFSDISSEDILEGGALGAALSPALGLGLSIPLKGAASLVNVFRRAKLGEALDDPNVIRGLKILEREGKLEGKTVADIRASGTIPTDVRMALKSVAERAKKPSEQIKGQLLAGGEDAEAIALASEMAEPNVITGQPRMFQIQKFLSKTKAPSVSKLGEEVTETQKILGLEHGAAKTAIREAEKDITSRLGGKEAQRLLGISRDDIGQITSRAMGMLKGARKGKSFTADEAKQIENTIRGVYQTLSPKKVAGGETVPLLDEAADLLQSLNRAQLKRGEFNIQTRAGRHKANFIIKDKIFSRQAIQSIRKALYEFLEDKLSRPALSSFLGYGKSTFTDIAAKQAGLGTLAKMITRYKAKAGTAGQATTGLPAALEAARRPDTKDTLLRAYWGPGRMMPSVSLGERFLAAADEKLLPITKASAIVDASDVAALQNIKDYLALSRSGLNVPEYIPADASIRPFSSLISLLASQGVGY